MSIWSYTFIMLYVFEKGFQEAFKEQINWFQKDHPELISRYFQSYSIIFEVCKIRPLWTAEFLKSQVIQVKWLYF